MVRGYLMGRRGSSGRRIKKWSSTIRKSFSMRRGNRGYGMRGNRLFSYANYFRLKGVITQQTTSANGFSQFMSLSNPTAYYDTVASGNTINDWVNVSALYDSYRVVAVKIQWIPNQMDNTLEVAGTTGGTIGTVTHGPMYVFVDYDNSNAGMPVSTESTVIQYENCRAMQSNRSWTRYVKCPKLGNTQLQGGFIDLAAPINCGCIAVYAPDAFHNVPITTTVGRFIVTEFIKFKNRR